MLRIELFGGLRAHCGGRVLTRFPTQKVGALLGYLAFHRECSHPRESLAELFWSDSDVDAARGSLRWSLWALRRLLEPDKASAGTVIIATRSQVQLNPAVVTDVAEFEAALQAELESSSDEERAQRLMKAADLYRGELLHGYFDEWIQPESARLTESYLSALRRLVKSLVQSRVFNHAIDYAHRAVAADPLRESSHRLLMRVHNAAGQPAAALQQFHELERLLKEHLNAAPSARTRELARDISDQLSVTSDQKAEGRTPSPITPSLHHSITPLLRSTGNLPPQFTRFFGREAEMAQLREWLLSEDVRLVTLTGLGGNGKTRLAIESAARLREEFNGRVWFVPLADITDTRLIADAMLDALRLPRSPQVDPLEQVIEALASQPSLLVLDNLEHLMRNGEWKMENGKWKRQGPPSIPHSPFSILRTLLERAPTLKCLVTSRHRLSLAGEREFLVSPLPTPHAENGHPSSLIPHPSSLITFASVQLFADRAQMARPDFRVTESNAAAVAELCSRLEGIPLALELAAVRAQVLTPTQMLAELTHRFDFLVSRRRDIEPRHHSLRAAMDWSYQLLSPELQRFFARLAVFRGGWTLEAAKAVCADAQDGGVGVWGYGSMGETTSRPDILGRPLPHPHTPIPPYPVLDLLEDLRECSLVLTEEVGDAVRYRLMETLREYAWERLWEQADEATQTQQRHAEFFLHFAEHRAAQMRTPDEVRALDEAEAEFDNLRAALQFVVSHVTQWSGDELVVSHEAERSGDESPHYKRRAASRPRLPRPRHGRPRRSAATRRNQPDHLPRVKRPERHRRSPQPVGRHRFG